MTPLSFKRQDTVNNYYNTSMHRTHTYNSPQRSQTKKEPYPSLTLWFCQVLTTGWSPLSTESPHTHQYLHWDSNHFITAKNSVYNTLAFRAKVVCINQQALQEEKWHISTKPYRLATSHHGSSTVYTTNLTSNTTAKLETQTIQQSSRWTMTATVDLTTTWVYRYTSEEPTPSKPL